MQKLLNTARLVRLPNAATAIADVYAGAALAGVSLTDWRVAVVALGSACLYAAGIALNDLLDLSKDRLLHPTRILPSGALSSPYVERLIRVLFALGALSALAHGGFSHIGITLGLIVSIVIYDLLPEGRPWVSSAMMGSCRAFSLLRGLTLGAGPTLEDPGLAATFVLGHFALVLMITLISQAEDTGETSPKTLGPKLLILAPYLLPGLAALAQKKGPTGLIPLLFAGGIALWLFVTDLLSKRCPTRVIVRRAVFGIILYDALIVGFARTPAEAFAVLCLWPLAQALAEKLQQRGS